MPPDPGPPRQSGPRLPAGASSRRLPAAAPPPSGGGCPGSLWRRAPGWPILGLSDRLGTIEAGKLADLLVVRGDLTADIQPLRESDNIAAILQGGRSTPRLRALAEA